MALKSIVYKVDLQVSDLDRSYYGSHALTLARHPSETDERLMVRLFAFALFADEALVFGRGLSTEDEPDLWQQDLNGEIALWIDVGLPDEKVVRKACGRARRVVVLSYGSAAADIWWEKNRSRFARLDNLTVLALTADDGRALGALAERGMSLQCTIQDGSTMLSGGRELVELQPRLLLAAKD